jgi:hypothetical protein
MDRRQLEAAVRARMTERGEDYATARRNVLAEAGQPGGEQRTATPPPPRPAADPRTGARATRPLRWPGAGDG